MISNMINSLKRKVPSAFEIGSGNLPRNPVEDKIHCEIIPFKKDLSANMKLSLYPADTFRITLYNLPKLESDSELNEESKEYGTEALVWYKPFHFYDAKWGIYVRWRGVLYAAYSLYKIGYEGAEVELVTTSLVKNAFKILHSHAYFHFLVEWAASFMEFMFEKPFYSPYVTYTSCKEGRTESNLEEPLANAYSLRQVDSRLRNGLSELCRVQPSPYREFDSYVDEEGFVLGKRRLGVCIHALSGKDLSLEARVPNLGDEPPWEVIFNAEPRQLCVWEVPIYWVAEPRATKSFSQVVQLLLSSYGDRIGAFKRTLGEALAQRLSQGQGNR